MPEYVYALHDFLPEHEDEVTFHVGERIEVVEKDDMYGDGWWQVCFSSSLSSPLSLFSIFHGKIGAIPCDMWWASPPIEKSFVRSQDGVSMGASLMPSYPPLSDLRRRTKLRIKTDMVQCASALRYGFYVG